MTALPAPANQTVSAIYAWWEAKVERPRAYLGASVVGRECERELWYGFRWCGTGAKFDGRMLRLFNRGHREEAVFIDELRGIGCDVRDTDPATGEQFRFKAHGGHFGCGLDGVASGIPEAPKTWHLLEFKTAGSKPWAALVKDGLAKAKPEYFAQVQVNMKLADLTRTLFLSVNKDTDEIYQERIRLDAAVADRYLARAERIIFAPEPPQRLSEDASFWKCKGCAFRAGCHGTTLPPPNCRNCAHSTPERDGDGRWTCARWRADVPLDAQEKGCDQHRYIPALLARWGEAVDASDVENWIEYRTPTGETFRNGAFGPMSFSSNELSKVTPALMRDPEYLAIRDRYAAPFVEYEVAA